MLHLSRFWCLFISALLFTATQLAATIIANPHDLAVVSSLTGFAYGFLFGVFPSLVAHSFGIGGLSQNWGVMTLSPVISGNVFNLLYGYVYDSRSTGGPDGGSHRAVVCSDGLACYRPAYVATLCAGVAGLAVCLWSIAHERRTHGRHRSSVQNAQHLA